MKIWLIIVFFVNGEPTLIDGWWPRVAPDMVTCMERADRVREYLGKADQPHNPGYRYEVHCYGGEPS